MRTITDPSKITDPAHQPISMTTAWVGGLDSVNVLFAADHADPAKAVAILECNTKKGLDVTMTPLTLAELRRLAAMLTEAADHVETCTNRPGLNVFVGFIARAAALALDRGAQTLSVDDLEALGGDDAAWLVLTAWQLGVFTEVDLTTYRVEGLAT